MGVKKNKAKISPKKTVSSRWSWINLPHDIMQLLEIFDIRNRRRRRCPVQPMGATATTKTWVLPTTRCSGNVERRWPELYLSGNSSNTSSASTRPDIVHMIYVAVWGGWCFGGSNHTHREALLECASHAIEPFGAKNKGIKFTQIIKFEGKFYALSLQGALAVIEEIESRLVITGMSSNRAVPFASSRFFKEYLVLMDGEIFLVFIIHQKSLEIVDEVEVLRFCSVKLKWIKVERLHGKALFMDQKCYWVNSEEIGCREDCVYFTQGSNNSWWLYDMESCCISPV